MADDDITRRKATDDVAASIQQGIDAMITSSQAADVRARVHAIQQLLEEEQASAAILEAKAAAASLLLPSSPPTVVPPGIDTEASIIATLHTQACGVQNIRSLVPITLDPSSAGYARLHD
ncbi:hypothetical protein GUJ93_ZPchr0008g12093 [Zizania palustris]|uniref:Uncharacterized protein n=1 Tax=Zizania palustris TaxID=103762 RepID=A0A8J5UX56_ZIZPA|nr:hypothetical protein GUJ93_ZPchr0008g12093 [Zizania palustris]